MWIWIGEVSDSHNGKDKPLQLEKKNLTTENITFHLKLERPMPRYTTKKGAVELPLGNGNGGMGKALLFQ